MNSSRDRSEDDLDEDAPTAANDAVESDAVPVEPDGAAASGEGDDPVAADDADDADEASEDATRDEPFERYQNSMYRLLSMIGAGLVAVIGLTGLAIGRTLDPIPPAQFFFIDGILTVLLLGWYLLGMRCRLDVAETWVHVATKYADHRIDRDQIVAVEADRSLWGSLQLSGRPLLIHHRTGEDGDEIRTRRAYGVLPNEAQQQQIVIEQLQDALGRPGEAEVRATRRSRRRRRGGDPDESASVADLEHAVAARLAAMQPEGDDSQDESDR